MSVSKKDDVAKNSENIGAVYLNLKGGRR